MLPNKLVLDTLHSKNKSDTTFFCYVMSFSYMTISPRHCFGGKWVYSGGRWGNFVVHTTKSWMSHPSCCLRTCQKLAGGRGWKQRGGHKFLSLRKGRGHEKWAVKRGRVMQIYASDHVEVHPQKKKEVLYLAKNKKKKYKNNGLRNVMDICIYIYICM